MQQAPMTQGQLDPLGPLVIRLERTIANLDAYIEQRAREIANPRIAATEQDAAEQVANAEQERDQRQQRSEDLVAELRRQLRALERQLTDHRQRVENVRAHLNRNLAGLVGKSGYEVGYRSCASEVTSILDTPSNLKEPGRG